MSSSNPAKEYCLADDFVLLDEADVHDISKFHANTTSNNGDINSCLGG